MASNFRALFQLQYNQWAKHSKSAKELWPLSIDTVGNELTEDEMYERNRIIIEKYKDKYGIN